MFHRAISLNSVLLLLLVKFVSGFRLELIYISLIIQVKLHSSPWFSAACDAAITHRNHSFRLHQQNKSFESKVMFRQASNCCKRVLEAAKLAYVSISSQKLGSWDFWRIAYNVINKGKSATPPLFTALEVLSSASDKAKLFAKNLSKDSNLDDSDISLPVYPF